MATDWYRNVANQYDALSETWNDSYDSTREFQNEFRLFVESASPHTGSSIIDGQIVNDNYFRRRSDLTQDTFARDSAYRPALLVIGGDSVECAKLFSNGFDVTTLDISQQVLNYVHKNVPETYVVLGNFASRDLAINQSFSGIWSCRSIIQVHPEDLQQAARNIANLLHP